MTAYHYPFYRLLLNLNFNGEPFAVHPAMIMAVFCK